MIEVDELICHRDVTDDIEFTNGFQLGEPVRDRGGRKVFSVERVLRPLSGFGQIFERFSVFDEDVHDELV